MLFAKLRQESGSFTHLGPKTLTTVTDTVTRTMLFLGYFANS